MSVFDTLKNQVKDTEFKFEKILPKFSSHESKLFLDLNIQVSLNAPGDHEAVMANIVNALFGLGNSTGAVSPGSSVSVSQPVG